MSQPREQPGCPGCRRRDQEVADLRAEVADLRRRLADLQQRLDQAQRDGKRQAAPFRRRTHPPHPKKPGRPKGHPPAARPLPEHVDRTVDVPCPECPDCHVPLVDPVVHPQYQTDLPPVVPVVTRFDVHGGTCPCCRRYHQGRHPERTSDAVGACANQVGPVALTMAAELKRRLGVPYRKITDFFATYFGLTVSPGTLARAEQRLARRARPTFDLLLDALRRCAVVHADETGWRIGRLGAWLWVFSSPSVTVYAIRGSRGHEVPAEVLGEDFDGWLVVDGLASYDVLEYKKGRCNAHLLRRCRELVGGLPSPAEAAYVGRLLALLREAIGLAGRRDALTEAGYARRVAQVEAALDGWIDDVDPDCGADVERLLRHVCAHRGEWLVFLHEAEVPPTNNHAERMLRPAVISRKVGGCNKTLLGACVHAVLASLMVSVHQQGRRFLDLALRLWREPEAGAIDLGSLPPRARPEEGGAGAGSAAGVPVAYCPSG